MDSDLLKRIAEHEGRPMDCGVSPNDLFYIARRHARLVEKARNLIRSMDNWKNVQPANPQVQQDAEALRTELEANDE